MRLTKLELNGFKSFAHKTELQFADGITAVIGPNGSGKSNIADAVRWVLGEQSARSLRGTRMEDVIFSGTQARRAQAYCEVTLTFDNADRMLALDFAEVALTRRVYRSGESEYLINKNPCRLRDVVDLFRDTGVGRDGYSIIGQGKVEEILANKSGDRRAALEEAAGVARFRARKEEAGRKLESTEKNLERIADILAELSGRLGPLEEQSRTAREYLKLRDELRRIEISLFLIQYERYGERLRGADDALKQLAGESALADGAERMLLSETAALEARLHEMDAALSERQNELIRLLSAAESQAGASGLLAEKRDHSVAECARLTNAREEVLARAASIAEALNGMRSGENAEEAVRKLNNDVAVAEADVKTRDLALSEQEARLESLKNSVIEAMNRLSDARSLISRFDAMSGSITARLDELSGLIDAQQAEHAALADELTAAATDEARILAECEATKCALSESEQHAASLEAAYRDSEARRTALEHENTAAQQRLRVLREMARAREGYYESVKKLMRDASGDAALSGAVVGVVAELIRVPKTYEQAVSMALGSSMQNIVTRTADDAKFVIEYLREKGYGRATLLPLDLLRTGPVRDAERAYLKSEGCFGLASELIECDPCIRGAVDYLLGRTAIVRDLDSGIALKRRAGSAFHIATLAGDTIATGGAMSGGSRSKREFSLLGREREIAELDERIKTLERQTAEAAERCETDKRDILLAGVQTDAFKNALHDTQVLWARCTEKKDIIARDLMRSDEKRERLLDEKQRLTDNLADLNEQHRSASAAQSDIEAGSQITREDVRQAQETLLQLRREREQAASVLTDRLVLRAALTKEQDAARREQERLTREHAAAVEEAARIAEECKLLTGQIDVLTQQLASAQQGAEAGRGAADAQKDAYRALEEERGSLSEQLAEQRARREALLLEQRERAERTHRQEMLRSRLELERTGMQDHIWSEYELTYENALPYRCDIAVGTANTRITELKNAIRSLGDVNVRAIEDYQSVAERHGQLSVQYDDLIRAKADLLNLIGELTQEMEKTFTERFKEIQTHFATVFSELFGGGQAALRLTDEHDVLGCEIDIIAQPPGKKLQLLTLLSGGERALTAIALLFALLRLKPPAFCILDEIESSLDEVNVSRFAGFLREYSDETQFILITHRRGSMEACDTLYGVSMEEKGVSRVLSARFGEVS